MATYVTDEDNPELPMWLYCLEWVMFLLFLFDYLLKTYLANDKCNHITSQAAVIDLIALLPAISLFVPQAQIGWLLHLLNFLTELRLQVYQAIERSEGV